MKDGRGHHDITRWSWSWPQVAITGTAVSGTSSLMSDNIFTDQPLRCGG